MAATRIPDQARKLSGLLSNGHIGALAEKENASCGFFLRLSLGRLQLEPHCKRFAGFESEQNIGLRETLNQAAAGTPIVAPAQHGHSVSMTDYPRPILIIDDDVMIADLVATILESDGYPVVMATDPAEGLRLARTVQPSVVLCDNFMPHMTGRELLEELRVNPATANIPFVLMSGERTNCEGLNGFLAKPFMPAALLEAVSPFVSGKDVSLAA